jgi:preprotein translocase subunit SecD
MGARRLERLARRRGSAARGGRLVATLRLAAALIVAMALLFGCSEPSELELRGGTRAEYRWTGETTLLRNPVPQDLEDAARVIELRFQALGTIATTTVNGDRLGIEAPGLTVEDVRAVVVPGNVELVPLPPGMYGAEGRPLPEPGGTLPPELEPLLGADFVEPATAGLDPTALQTAVTMRLRPDAARVLAQHTERHVGEHLAIVVDGVVVAVAMISAPIPNGELAVTADERFARRVGPLLRSGPLTVVLVEVGISPVPPASR